MLASIDFIGIDPKDLPKEVEKNRIDLFQIRPSQHQNNKGEADQGFINWETLLKEEANKDGQ